MPILLILKQKLHNLNTDIGLASAGGSLNQNQIILKSMLNCLILAFI
jgi:hypothetical protein